MALKAVFFDVGETLVDETRMWERAADEVGVSRFTLMGVLGGLAARGEPHARTWEILEVERRRVHKVRISRSVPHEAAFAVERAARDPAADRAAK